MTTRHAATTILASALLLTAIACSGDAGSDAGDSASRSDAAATGAAAVELNDANLEALERGLQKEIEIIRRPGRAGSHYGVSLQARDPEAQEVAEAAGMSVLEYRELHDAVERVLTTLNLQGKIGPPRSVDLEKASDEFRARYESDPYAELPSGSADALRRWEERLAKVWGEIVSQTAVAG